MVQVNESDKLSFIRGADRQWLNNAVSLEWYLQYRQNGKRRLHFVGLLRCGSSGRYQLFIKRF